MSGLNTLRVKNSINRFNLYYAYITKKSASKGFPNIAVIELTNDCNKDCLPCPHKNMARPIGYMDFNLYKDIVDQLSLCEFVQPFFLGESLLHKEIDKAISYLKRKNMPCSIFTNGALLTRENSEKIINSGLDHLQISLNAVSKQIYKEMESSSDFNHIVENLHRFLAINRGRIYTTISVLDIEKNRKGWERFANYWKAKGAGVRFKPFTDWNSDDKSITRFGKCVKRPGREVFPCDWLWRQFHILWDGRVIPCCFDYNGDFALGDTTKDSIKAIWNNRSYIDLRKNHINGGKKISICEGCNRRKIRWIEMPFLALLDAYTIFKLTLLKESAPRRF